MYGVIGESPSDASTLQVLIRSLAKDDSVRVRKVGYVGYGEMLRKGAAQLKLFQRLGSQRFVVSYDSDGHDPGERREEVMVKIVRPCGVEETCCVLIPVQEIEAWILADIQAVSKVFTSWRPQVIKRNPEDIANPKEYLEALSRAGNRKPIYSHTSDNERVAKYLDPDVVASKCPSFLPLVKFVTRK